MQAVSSPAIIIAPPRTDCGYTSSFLSSVTELGKNVLAKVSEFFTNFKGNLLSFASDAKRYTLNHPERIGAGVAILGLVYLAYNYLTADDDGGN